MLTAPPMRRPMRRSRTSRAQSAEGASRLWLMRPGQAQARARRSATRHGSRRQSGRRRPNAPASIGRPRLGRRRPRAVSGSSSQARSGGRRQRAAPAPRGVSARPKDRPRESRRSPRARGLQARDLCLGRRAGLRKTKGFPRASRTVSGHRRAQYNGKVRRVAVSVAGDVFNLPRGERQKPGESAQQRRFAQPPFGPVTTSASPAARRKPRPEKTIRPPRSTLRAEASICMKRVSSSRACPEKVEDFSIRTGSSYRLEESSSQA